MGASVVQARQTCRQNYGDSSQDQHRHSRSQHPYHRHYHFEGLKFLAEDLRSPSYHQSGQEHGHDSIEEHAYEADSHSAEDHLAYGHVKEKHESG